MNELFAISQILVKESFTRNSGGEQIDGAFELDGWYYLVECRWRTKVADMSELDGLSGKVDRSGIQTMGVFISVNGWSSNVEKLMKQNSDKNLVLVNGVDIRATLKDEIPFVELLRAKMEALNLKSEPFVGVTDILSKQTP